MGCAAAPASRQTAILVPLALDGRYADRPRTSVPVLLKVGLSMRPPQNHGEFKKGDKCIRRSVFCVFSFTSWVTLASINVQKDTLSYLNLVILLGRVERKPIKSTRIVNFMRRAK